MDFKKLRIITHQPERSENLRTKRKGILIHKLLSLYNPKEDLGTTLKRALLALGENPNEWDERELVEPVKRLLQNESIRKWFEREAFSELELVDQEGNLHRVDRLLVDKREVWAIEFKVGKKRPEHLEQLKGYVNLLKEIFPDKLVHGALLYVESGELTLI
jgi:hypothetical protein